MREIIVIFLWYPLFGVPAVIGGLLVLPFLDKRVHLQKTDWSLLFLPWILWIGLMIINGTGKSLSNLIEAVILGCITAAFFAVRAVLEVFYPKFGQRLSYLALIGSCLSAVALWAFVPGLPE
jgi:hypothetical protein